MADDGKIGAKEKRLKSKDEPAKAKGGASKAQDGGKADREARRAANQAEREARRQERQAERKGAAASGTQGQEKPVKPDQDDAAKAEQTKPAQAKTGDPKQIKDKPAKDRPEQSENKAKRLAAQEANAAARAEKRENWLAKQAVKAAAAESDAANKAQNGSASQPPATQKQAVQTPAFKAPSVVVRQAAVTPSTQPLADGAPSTGMAAKAATDAAQPALPSEIESPAGSAAKGKGANTRQPGGKAAKPKAVKGDLDLADKAKHAKSQTFNILIVGQAGRLAREAVLFAASLRRHAPDWKGRLIVAEPQPEGAWAGVQTRIPAAERALLEGYRAEILPFTAQHFGRSYPYGNKIEALSLLPAREPFVFFDSDTLVLGPLDRVPFDFARPSASMRREGTWPEPPLYGPGYSEIWRSLYDRFQLDFDSSLDIAWAEDDWQRYLYFNAGWFFGFDPESFAKRFMDAALKVRDEPGEALACQSLDPWLDQAVLPLVIHSLHGGRPGQELAGLDGDVTCHYRNLSLLYARESDAAIAEMEALMAEPTIAALFAQDKAAQRVIVARQGRERIRPMFAEGLPPSEKVVRQLLKRDDLWFNH